MRFHVVGLPFTQTTEDYPACAFTMKVRKFCKMMVNAGHTVYLYSGEHNTTPCTEHIACITEEERAAAVGEAHYTMSSFDYTLPHWRRFNQTAAREIRRRAATRDFVCVIGGYSHKPIADELPDLMTVEFGIGYPGTFAKYRVFESYAWMHTVYGSSNPNPAALNGNFYDTVINGYLDEEEFYYGHGDGGYLMFIGRLNTLVSVLWLLALALLLPMVSTLARLGLKGPICFVRRKLFSHRRSTLNRMARLFLKP